MALSVSERLAITARVEAEREKLERKLADPALYDAEFIYKQLNDILGYLSPGGGTPAPGGGTASAVDIEVGVVAANSSANAISITPSTRVLITNATGTTSGGSLTIATNAWGYQILALEGTFTLSDGSGVTYSATANPVGVTRSVSRGFRWPAITITPGNSSKIYIEELR